MTMGDKEQLLEFGFPELHVDNALKATNNGGLQQALDWLSENEGKPILDEPLDKPDETPSTEPADPSSVSDEQAQSLVCNECNKQFKNEELAQYHAVKSGHTDFAQSTDAVKPLSEEEKKRKLAELQDRIAEKRRLRDEEEKQDQRKNEILRRKAGQDMTEQQERMKEEQMKRDIEKQKQLKEEDKRATARIKQQIEQDKRDRAMRAAKEKAERDGAPLPVTEQTSMLKQGLPKIETSATQTRLQIRPMVQIKGQDGPVRPVTCVFEADQTLKDVIKHVKQQLPGLGHHFKLSTSFPRKDFGASDESKTLRELGLVPNAALILTE
ncbi:hypothetical protein IW139_004453 [Coemansia sp. RSA 353]|nr:hypothetical protein LPJ58_004934 [Coemansia sp. RSA 1591]KAJ1756027.1 hypothetical protein LPJ69_004905 [Coemansia sp. RSA 1752]KAJ1781871.1 hypothetical protein LPJ62_005661 [Coemansia sp. RSA 2167]KAJ1783169.1 hypothetical protein LPJ67_004815 [Coemansia sp. RSA 1938]KAJ2169200.1 hypothetical protein GGH15_000718 [Coemansia sp. RSA 562]KAJ2191565.1 hypothetical protein EV181_000238 [Coemansia sp. RSA 532]KAJ2192656.1 hypothetical protein IW144_004785 [Coemansia sp. RSA 522]KAJ2202723.1